MALTRQNMDPQFGHVFIYEHCLPFDVTRAFDEANGIADPVLPIRVSGPRNATRKCGTDCSRNNPPPSNGPAQRGHACF